MNSKLLIVNISLN